mgnify:CR=1 FL=1
MDELKSIKEKIHVFNHFSKEIKSEIKIFGLSHPTEIQKKAIPEISKGTSVLVISATGTGKTETAILPIFDKIIKEKNFNPIQALYITPLRTLNRDILRRIKDIGNHLNLKINVRHSDTTVKEKREQADNPPILLITTPETLGIILNLKKYQSPLKNIKYVIIDEFHELIESKRGVQLSLNLERLRRKSENDLQLIGLSATISSPEYALKLLIGKNRKGKVISSSNRRDFKMSLIYSPHDLKTNEFNSEILLLKHIKDVGRVLVFTNTRSQAEALAHNLKTQDKELKIGVHHGSLAAQVREDVETSFNDSLLDTVVCTSSMELGVDIRGVKSVVQWSSPRKIIKLSQRVGRSEHKPGVTAKGLLFSRTIDDFFESLAITKLLQKGILENHIIYENCLDVLSHQIIGFTLNNPGISLKEIFNIIIQSEYYSTFKEDDLITLAFFLSRVRLIRIKENNLFLTRNSIQYYFQNLSTIPNILSYRLYDPQSRKIIANLDEAFVGENCDRSSKILVNGQTWRIVNVHEDERKVDVVMDNFDLATIPRWIGELQLVEKMVAINSSELRKLWFNPDKNDDLLYKEKITGVESLKDIKKSLSEILNKNGSIPGVNNLTISFVKGDQGNIFILHLHMGDRINQTIAQILKPLLKSMSGIYLDSTSSAYRIFLIDRTKSLSLDLVSDSLKKLSDFKDKIDEILIKEIVKHGKFLWIFWNVCKRMGVIKKDTTYRKRMAEEVYYSLRFEPPVTESLNEIKTKYFDINSTKEILNDIYTGKIPIYTNKTDTLNQIEKDYLFGNNTSISQDYLDDEEAINLLKSRVNKKRISLLCINCFSKKGPCSVEFLLKYGLNCSKCKSQRLGVYYPTDEIKVLIQKIQKRERLNENELIQIKKIRTCAKIVNNFGIKALWCLTAYGVGVGATKRILRRGSLEKNEIFRRILKEEKKYFETRMYWKI